jgi:hypothetical protein
LGYMGDKFDQKLEERVNRKGMTTTLFKWARKFYKLYPQMADNLPVRICATMMHQFMTPGKTIISHLSFTHLREIMTLDDPLARYSLAGMDNQLFVSTYMLQLTDKKTLEDFLLKQLREQES